MYKFRQGPLLLDFDFSTFDTEIEPTEDQSKKLNEV